MRPCGGTPLGKAGCGRVSGRDVAEAVWAAAKHSVMADGELGLGKLAATIGCGMIVSAQEEKEKNPIMVDLAEELVEIGALGGRRTAKPVRSRGAGSPKYMCYENSDFRIGAEGGLEVGYDFLKARGPHVASPCEDVPNW